MKLTIVGSGDAFSSGGRLQTCFHVTTGDFNFLIDCGATSLMGMAREGLDPEAVDAIFITHLHGDHFSGLVWWMLHAQHVLKRERTLIVVGPRGTESRFKAAAECLFPGSTEKRLPFEMTFFEHVTAVPFDWRGLSCSAVDVSHPSGAPSHGLRFDYQGKSISYSGDTEWVDALIGLSEGADLHINECFAFDSALRYHTSWSVLKEKLSRLTAKRVMLTHMGVDMLAHLKMIEAPNVSFARDGLVLEI